MSEEKVPIKVSSDTYKRLKLISIVEKKSVSQLLNEIVKERYGLRRTEIEDLVIDTSHKTRVKDD